MPITRKQATDKSIHRKLRAAQSPIDEQGEKLRVSDYFGMNSFDVQTAKGILKKVKDEIAEIVTSGKALPKEHAAVVAKALTDWAIEKGATHFCHWFQPLTGSTAEKHDAFLDFEGDIPIEKFSASQLMQGEPDASSFPNGGVRSTFEARGYTAWDLTSPIFIREGLNGKTLCIPTAFVSYSADALDVKTPLLRSISALNLAVTKYMNLTGSKKTVSVKSTAGSEQEYFLVDKSLYFARPDLVMTGRTLFGAAATKNQQLSDHYFGTIPARVLAYMQEVETELYKLGVPAKTRHNEVAPGQYEIAPIFRDANVATDHNQLILAILKEVAGRHDFVCLTHEKPFTDINGSGKHVNWSMADNLGHNLLEPGDDPENNFRFLTTVSVICEAVHRHADILRMAISGAGNDHRLGGHEAPPSIISIFLGDTITRIFESILDGKSFESDKETFMDLGASQLADLLKDNTDRNRTSPFAFTGNKFEFRAVGSSQNVGLPLSILNAAVAEVMNETNEIIENEISLGHSIDDALTAVTKKWLESCFAKIVFNGDGYSKAWLDEAQKRGLPNLKTTADALLVLKDEKATNFLTKQGVYRSSELAARFAVLVENYNTQREIEFDTLVHLVEQNVLPAAITYKQQLLDVVCKQKDAGGSSSLEKEILHRLNHTSEQLYTALTNFKNAKKSAYVSNSPEKISQNVAGELMPQSEEIATFCNELEDMIPDNVWTLPKYRELLFLR